MARKVLSLKEIYDAMSSGQQVSFMIWAAPHTYVGKVVRRIADTRLYPSEVRPAFVFCGEIPGKGVGGSFEVVAGQLFTEEGK